MPWEWDFLGWLGRPAGRGHGIPYSAFFGPFLFKKRPLRVMNDILLCPFLVGTHVVGPLQDWSPGDISCPIHGPRKDPAGLGNGDFWGTWHWDPRSGSVGLADRDIPRTCLGVASGHGRPTWVEGILDHLSVFRPFLQKKRRPFSAENQDFLRISWDFL